MGTAVVSRREKEVSAVADEGNHFDDDLNDAVLAEQRAALPEEHRDSRRHRDARRGPRRRPLLRLDRRHSQEGGRVGPEVTAYVRADPGEGRS